MDLAITDFVKRSAEIAFGATKGSLKDYGANVGELVTASKDIKDKLMPEVKNARQAFSSMKRSGPISSISNWFYSKEYEIGDGDDMLSDTDEFDSGNPNLTDDSSDSSSTVLDASTAKGLARSQVSAMYKIGSKQTEASVANTAEIISNMSQRSADMIAAINNVNSTLINISNKMDNLITLLSPQQGVQDINHSSIYDSSGKLSLSSISSALGNRASSTFGSSKDMLSMIKRAFTPEEVFRMTVVDRVFNKNLNALGGRSIDEMGKAFNKASGDAIQSILNTALQNTPLGDFLLKGNRKSFADVSSQNQYTKDAAVFDKATRHTIVSIIPEYLKKITEAVTGQKWNIDERGTVTTKTVANPFKQAGTAILGASINYDSMNRLNTTIEQYSNQAISSQDQSAAVNALLIVYILQEKYNHPRQIIDSKQINNTFLTSPNRRQYTEMAVNIFVQNSMISDKNKAREIINTVWTYLATDKELARSFAQAVNSNYDKMYQAGKTIDANNPLAHQYANDSSISYDDMLNLVKSANVKGMLQYDYDYNAEYNRLKNQYGGRSTFSSMRIENKLKEWDRENRSKYFNNEEEEVTSRIGQANVSGKSDNSFFAQQKKLFASLTKYTHGIYDILNSGVVNVRMVGQPVRRAVRNHREIRVSSSFGGGSSSTDDGGGADEPPQPSTDTPQPLPILPTAGYTGEMSASERAFNAAMGYGSQATTTVRNFLSGGPVGMIRNEVSNIGTDIHAVGNRAIQLKSNQLHLDSMQRNVTGSDNISERDKMKFQAINTAINTAMQDGSGTEDKAKIRSMIQEIEDPELRRDLEKTSTALLTAHSEKVEPTSKLGKLLSMAKPVLTFVLAPIRKVLGLMLTGLKKYWSWTKKMWASGARDIVRGGRQIRQGLFGNREYTDKYGITHNASKGAIRSIGGGLIGLNRGIINGMPDGLTLTGDAMDLAGGIRNAGSSFIAGVRGKEYSDAPSSLPQRGDYGSREEFNDAMREYRRNSVSSTFGNLGNKLRNSKFANKVAEDVSQISDSKAVKGFVKIVSKVASGLKKFGSVIAKTASFIASLPGKLAKGAEWLGGKANKFTSWVGKGVQKVEDRIANSAVGNAITQSATFQGAKALVGNVISAPGRALAGTGQFLSGVGAGFRESMAEAKRDKQQARLKAQGPQTIADQETESINKKLETGEGKFFTSVLDLLTSISTNTEKDAGTGAEETPASGGAAGNNNAGDNDQEIHTVDIPAGPTNSLGGNMEENAPASYGNSQTDAAGPSAEGGDNGGAKGAGKGIGKMLGGIMSVLGGIMKIVGPVLMAMEGIQMIQKLVQETLTKVLKPLDKIFKKLFKVLSPILDTLTKSLEPLMDCIVTVLDGIITPLAPVIQGIFEAVSPLLEIVAGLVEVIMVPLMAVFDKVLVPIIKQIGSAVKVIMGVVQMGFGALMVPLGGIMALIGKLPLVGGKGIGSKGKEIAQMGKDMIKGGAQMAVEGVKEFVAATLERLTLGAVGGDNDEKEEEKPSNVYQSKDSSTYDPGALEGLMASGDSTVVNNYYQNTYGSGNTTYNQHSYSSSGLNMHDHGCGPIALADRVNRTLGGRVDPNALAKSMAASGNYSSTRGTSIAGMLNTGRALGMNMQVGGVTPHSLSQATPNNPITVIGSGIGYDTRDGNNHFMNVLGTNGSGMAYVSNPMTGRVSRTPLNQLALHSKLGLYGSGDIEDNFNFGDAAKNAFSELKNLWTGITNIFNFESGESAADKMKSSVNKIGEDAYIKSIKSHYSANEWQAAYDAYVEANPKEDGESDSDYEHRVNMAVAEQLAEEYKSGIDLDKMTSTVSTFGDSLNRYADENVNDYDPSSDYSGMSVSEFVNKTAMAFKAAKDMSYSHGSAGTVTLDDGTVIDNFRPDCSGIISAGIRAMGYGIHGNKNNNFTTFDFYESRGGPRLGGNSVITEDDGTYSDDWEILPISDDAKRRGDIFIAPGTAFLNGSQVDGHMNMFIMNRNGTDVGFTGGSGGGINSSGLAAEAMLANEENWQDKLPGIQTNKLGIGWVEASDTILRYKGNKMAGVAGDSLNEQMWQWLRFKSGLNLPEESAAGVIGVWNAEGRKPRMIEGAYSEPEISLAEPLYDLSTGNPDDHPGVFDEYTPEHAAGKNGGSLPNYYAPNNHLYPGLGLAQWTAGRGYNLLKFTHENGGGMKWYELVPQLNYFKKELDESYTGVKQTLKNGGSAADMAEAFARQFEGYNWSSDGITKRRQLAEEIYSEFKDSKEINPMNQGINSEWDAYASGMGSQAYKEQLGADPQGNSSSGGSNNGNWHINSEPVILNSGSSEWADKMKAKYEATIDGKYTHEGVKTVGDIIFDDYVRSMKYPKSLYMGPDKNRQSPLLPPFVGYTGATWNAARSKLKSYGKDYKDSSGKNYFTEKALKKALYSFTPTQNALEYNLMKDTINPDKDTSKAPYAYMLDLAIGRSAPGYFTGSSDIGPGKLVQDMSKVTEKINKYTDMDNNARGLRGYNYIYNGNVNNNTISGIPKIYTNDWIDLKHKAEAYTAAGSGDASIMDIPPIDYNDLGFGNSNQYSAQAIPTQYVEINKYNSPTDDQIDRLLAHEFKVSDEKNAEILNKIYAILLELNGGKDGAPTTDGGIPIDQMFNNEIPESIYRLSRG